MAMLAGIAAGWRPAAASAQQKVPLVLGHLTIVLDSATWHDASTSPFIRSQFAATQGSLTGGLDLRAVTIFGKYNYLVLARAFDSTLSPGDVAIALASQQVGGVDQLERLGSFARNEVGEGQGRWDDIDTGFHQLLATRTVRTRFAITEWNAASLRSASERDSLPVDNLSNSRFLARGYDRQKPFEYLSAATLAVPLDDIAAISSALERDSVTVLHEGEGVIIKLDGFTLHLIPPWGGAGVKQLQFALTRDVAANPVYRFGPRSRLRFGPGPIAVWDFTAR